MTTLLRIDSSAQLEDRSLTRRLTNLFIAEYRKRAPSARIVTRDVGHFPVPPIDHRFIHAAFTAPEKREDWMAERLALSDELIDEVMEADILVMGVPMYNYGIPSTLKAWIDHIARIGRTFSFDLSRGDKPIAPILSGKRLVVLSSRGEFGFAPGGVRAHMNALDPAIAACAHYFGVSADAIETVAIEYQEFKDDRHRSSIEHAEARAREIAGRLAMDALEAA
ncbi:FMN-dependent NADH-azoreductase [Rhizobium sp. LCM 4573]|uniref:FMN-dependent NADH-azoreductase n=1 Tax=Rhizobium sp. LCM 4573 TaxID=1848291 RepID=UPI0008DAEC38|nr:NAD(P)H-dependent oxidoreductase [Rhizobium sp. LCM 4573]OHV75968.1 FMN-dependent NADH-azoreductase [Rhizobium sp. LCM 4573]